MRNIALTAIALALAGTALPAAAQSAGSWTLGAGVHEVNPASDNGRLAGGTLPLDIGSDIRPTITAEYFVRDNLGIELLASLPFEHGIAVDGIGRVGSTRHLPPTVSVQYHFNTDGTISPFVGAGINHTLFFEEGTRGALAGSELELEDSWGLAARAGVDFKVGDRGAVRLDVRWIDIDAEVRVDGARLGTATIDPLAYGVTYVRHF